jgi:hypothetical protein
VYDRAPNVSGAPLYGSGAPLGAILPAATTDVMLLIFLGLDKRDERFLKSLAAPLLGLLLIDFIFNLYSIAFGVDPLGREISQRADDIVPRVGGVFGHAFQSINVSVIAILLAWHFRRKLWLALGILNIVINGSFRGVLALVVMLAVYVLLRRRLRVGVLVAALTMLAASVFGITIISAVQSELSNSGNVFRVFAWQNALDVIEKSPLIGFHDFQFGELEGIDFNSISDFGIAESTYLDYAMRFGILAAVAHFLVILYFLARRTALLRTSDEDSHFNMTSALFVATLFVDTFYGSMFGAVLPTLIFGFFCVSVRGPGGAPDLEGIRSGLAEQSVA